MAHRTTQATCSFGATSSIFFLFCIIQLYPLFTLAGDQQQFFSSGTSYPQQQPGYGIGFAPQQPGMQPGFHPSAFAPSAGSPDGYSPYDAESATVKGFDFNDQTIRRGFIKKVYSILTVSVSSTVFALLFVNCIIAVFFFSPPSPAATIDHVRVCCLCHEP